ncbi:hypothetical protein ACH5RR_035685 [Cinchona calisaya]|uniref:F-box domain-containing protein n=1 Tax=Cinchona calisaya TaxID=153742 RepID=A0ABD2Y3B8_9GENT
MSNSSKKQKKEMKNSSSSSDLISEIPNETLVDILSLLPMKEAARTSVLSRRWEKLWKFYSGCLDFDDLKTIVLLNHGLKDFDTEQRKFSQNFTDGLFSQQPRKLRGLKWIFHVYMHLRRRLHLARSTISQLLINSGVRVRTAISRH